MQTQKTDASKRRSWLSMKDDVDGLWVIMAVLAVLLLMPGPSEAEFKARDIKMNDIIAVDDMKSKN